MTSIFGPNFKSSEKYANKVIEDMIHKDILSPYGMIKKEKIPLISKSELWGYVFYLWFHNKTIFQSIKSHIRFRVDVQNWVVDFLKSTIQETNLKKYVNEKEELIYFTKVHLIMFIHNWVMIPNIHIPIVKDLQKKYPKELMDRLIDEEEKKYNDMIKQIEQQLNNPKVTVLEDSMMRVSLSLRNK